MTESNGAFPSGSEAQPGRDVRFNAFVNLMDGAFFGTALGFASFITVIPLFVSQLTESAILIGLVPAIHVVGWQLPQLLTARRVQRLSRYKPMVLMMTLHERLPFFGLALVAWLLPGLDRSVALILIFLLLVWQGFGGGWTATVWQSMIGKIIPTSWRGGFFGAQSSAANLMASVTAVAAGWILEGGSFPINFATCFFFAGLGMVISFLFLAATREKDHTPAIPADERTPLKAEVLRILSEDRSFRQFLLIRIVHQFGLAAFSFYSVYAVKSLGVSAAVVGWLTGVLVFAEMLVNPMLGALGDRKGHRLVLVLGLLAGLLSAGLAGWLTTIPLWFVIFGLTGLAYAVGWTTSIVLSLEFGTPKTQATYIGMANTLIAPATLLAPFLAGWMVEGFGYQVMFRSAAAFFLLATLLSINLIRSGQIPSSDLST